MTDVASHQLAASATTTTNGHNNSNAFNSPAWSPFLAVCLASVALFILFAAITFALMKFVKFTTRTNEAIIRIRRGHNSKQINGNHLQQPAYLANGARSLASRSNCSSSGISSASSNQVAHSTPTNNLMNLLNDSSTNNSYGKLHRARLINLPDDSSEQQQQQQQTSGEFKCISST